MGCVLTFHRENLTAETWPEMLSLNERHIAEVGNHAPLRLDQAKYISLAEQGSLLWFTVRAGGELMGYCGMLACTCPHDGLTEAHEDAIYTSPEVRGAGIDFEHWMDQELARLNIQRSFRERIIHPESKDRALRRGPIGYSPHSVLWRKELAPALVEA